MQGMKKFAVLAATMWAVAVGYRAFHHRLSADFAVYAFAIGVVAAVILRVAEFRRPSPFNWPNSVLLYVICWSLIAILAGNLLHATR